MPDGLKPYDIADFGGLNLVADPEETGSAVDGVDFDLAPGRVRSRNGWTKYTVTPAAAEYVILHRHGLQLIASTLSNQVDAIVSGAVLASGTMKASYGFVTIGTGANSYTYGPSFSGNNTSIARWNGAAWASPAVGYQSTYIGLTPTDNRLILAAEQQPVVANSRVRFSDPGAPETFTANSYVDLFPGDTEWVRGICTWRDMVFVFKETRFFVFNGTSTDATGNPVFNYRTVDAGVGVEPNSYRRGCVAARDGVYFIASDGIYRTSGGPPVRVSQPIDALWAGHLSNLYSGNVPTMLEAKFISAVGERVYFSIDNGGTFVYDIPTGQWLYWSLHTSTFVAFQPDSGVDRAMFGRLSAPSADIAYLTPTATTDGGSAINATYRSAFTDLNQPGMEKTVRETALTGKGTVAFSWARNQGSPATASNVVLGTAPAVARGLHRDAAFGETLGFKIASVSGGAWEVNRVVPMVRETRPAGTFA